MKNSHFHALLIFLILAFAAVGYWSYSTITFDFGGSTSTGPQVIDNSGTDSGNSNVPPPVADGANDPGAVAQGDSTTPATGANASSPASGASSSNTTVSPTSSTTPAATKYADLISKLQGLIADKVSMHVGSRGTRVGTVQTFINTYENKSNPIDNKYGAGLQKSISAFQTATGDTADGLADPGTYQKMIDWLKSQ